MRCFMGNSMFLHLLFLWWNILGFFGGKFQFSPFFLKISKHLFGQKTENSWMEGNPPKTKTVQSAIISRENYE